jgi:hypothetical protein
LVADGLSEDTAESRGVGRRERPSTYIGSIPSYLST